MTQNKILNKRGGPKSLVRLVLQLIRFLDTSLGSLNLVVEGIIHVPLGKFNMFIQNMLLSGILSTKRFRTKKDKY